jgi:hypothetical protein
MDKLGYIPDDLVMTNEVPLGTAKDVVYRVTSSDPTKTLELDDGTVLKGVVCLENIEGAEFGDKGYLSGDCCAWVKDIVPIPLTQEILEKNGWKRNGGQYSFTFKSYVGYKVELIGFFIEMFKDVHDMLKYRYFQITHENKVICGCFYVHESQHLLFGLGINHKIEV